jgi:hypothetical protein
VVGEGGDDDSLIVATLPLRWVSGRVLRRLAYLAAKSRWVLPSPIDAATASAGVGLVWGMLYRTLTLNDGETTISRLIYLLRSYFIVDHW